MPVLLIYLDLFEITYFSRGNFSKVGKTQIRFCRSFNKKSEEEILLTEFCIEKFI